MAEEGVLLTTSQADQAHVLLIDEGSARPALNNLRLVIRANDAYFHPTEGGQHLLSAYPVAADLQNTLNRLINDQERITALDEIFTIVATKLRWAMIATSAAGELLLAARPGLAAQRFKPGAAHNLSPSHLWTRVIARVPWPTVDECE
jgi:hypothetical protein